MQRKKWADIAKAFAIIAVVVGHTENIPSLLSAFIFSFHMPLFFVMSGYFMKDTDNIKSSIKKDAKNLLIPYAATCLLITALAAVVAFLKKQSIITVIKTWVFASAYGSGGLIPSFLEGKVRGIGAIWFLLALFFAKSFIYLTQELGKYQWVGLLIIGYIGYSTTNFIWLPFSIQAGMCAAFYVYLGKQFNKYRLFEKTYNSGKISLYISLPLIWIFTAYYGGRLYMVGNTYGNGLLDVIGSFCAVFTIVWISMLIEKFIPVITKFFGFIGKNTLIILCTHIIEMNVFPWLLLYNIFNIPRNWEIALIFRIALIAVMSFIIYWIPFINQIYYPSKRKKF